MNYILCYNRVMRRTYIAYAYDIILRCFALMIAVPILVALIYKQYESALPFLYASLFAYVLSLFFKLCHKGANIENLNDIKKSECLFIVVSAWIIGGIIAAIPYVFFGIPPIDALFEAVSGITTTGAGINTNMDYPNAVFFWRSFTQWLGGMGIIVLFIAILPQFAVAGRQMFFAESPGPTEEKFTPRIRSTATSLWKIYVLLTSIEVVLLYIAGMPLFDAVCNSFSTLSAGGFSPNGESIMGYNSMYITWIVLVFIFLSGVNFNIQFKALTKCDLTAFFKSEEFRVYLFVFLGISALVCGSLILNDHYKIFDAVTHSMYQVISLMTSTGSTSSDYSSWHFTTKVLLFIAMLTGGCASSASGGIKIARWVLIWKIMRNEVKKIIHPNAVINVKMDNSIISRDILSQTVMFVSFFMALIGISIIIISILEQNVVVGISGSIAAIGNIGPGFGNIIGPMGGYETLHPLSKLVFITDMLIGRLELIPFLAFLERDFWSFSKG